MMLICEFCDIGITISRSTFDACYEKPYCPKCGKMALDIIGDNKNEV